MSSSSDRRSDSPPGLGPSTYARAPKGAACLNCRRRKMKCDCARPFCGQCIRFSRERDCEYTDGDQRSRTEILEENIAVLQARVRQLESNKGTAPGVPTSSVMSYGENPPIKRMDVSGSKVDVEPSAFAARELVEIFLPFALDLGFFLNIPRFLQRLNVHFANPSPQPLPSALLNVVYLWGKRLSRKDDNRTEEEVFLTKAIQQLSTNLSRPNTSPLLLLQAQILLVNYFFDSARFVEARAQLSSAVSLALTLKLHKIRSSVVESNLNDFKLIRPTLEMSQPLDGVDEGERIYAFWVVYVLDQAWSVAFSEYPFIYEDRSPSRSIDTPWPARVEVYEQSGIPEEYRSNSTITRYFDEPITPDPLPYSPITARAKAAALLSRAVSVARAVTGPSSLQKNAEFTLIDAQLEAFILSLPSLSPPPDLPSEVLRHLSLTHMIARLAIIQLHVRFTDEVFMAALKSLSACKAIVNAFRGLIPEPDDTVSIQMDPLVLVSALDTVLRD